MPAPPAPRRHRGLALLPVIGFVLVVAALAVLPAFVKKPYLLHMAVVLFLAEDGELCEMAGDRTRHRYRAIARRQLGASCPLAIAPPDKDELSATLADWLDEFERVHLMLRVSPRLRQKHGD